MLQSYKFLYFPYAECWLMSCIYDFKDISLYTVISGSVCGGGELRGRGFGHWFQPSLPLYVKLTGKENVTSLNFKANGTPVMFLNHDLHQSRSFSSPLTYHVSFSDRVKNLMKKYYNFSLFILTYWTL